MSNPWLSIPLSDYEGHMSAPGVGQLAALSLLFSRALKRAQPRTESSRARHRQAHRQGVDEETDHFFNAVQIGRTARDGASSC